MDCPNSHLGLDTIYLYHDYYGNSDVIEVIISLQNSSGFKSLCHDFFFQSVHYKIVIPWQHRDY